ncbi:hypothetical protein SAMN05216474_0454 [Lishizhenia tianjinensis]|uniref:DUF4870 domain-containing protein n=1 Tax=Lishizhenia tianjinensis TaxID=477690 RepID=A0A1I6XTY0_9FLAO|nr:DUF4870 domain-containing protein [Lishizhenia tianjinensis]SFT41888.1 hypothetical protein SAMN05216474_0454 [Lishizhenia tianjinensis]
MENDNLYLDDELLDLENEDKNYKPWGMSINQYSMLMHLSPLTSILFSFVGIALPIIMWSTQKNQSKTIDKHGKNILNWMISLIIYFTLSYLLSIIFIGLIFLIILGGLGLIFAIIGAVKASNGQFYKYPLSIPFFK